MDAILLAFLASRNCFARSSPKRYWLLMGTLVEEMADYSAFSDGFISIPSQLGKLCVYMLQHCNGVNLLCHDFDIVWKKGIVNQHVCGLQSCKCSFADNLRKFDIFRSVFLCLAVN